MWPAVGGFLFAALVVLAAPSCGATLRGGKVPGGGTTQDALDDYYRAQGGATSLSAVTGDGEPSSGADFRFQQASLGAQQGQQEQQQAAQQQPVHPYARDGGAYDAWKNAQARAERRAGVVAAAPVATPPTTASLERFQGVASFLREDPGEAPAEEGETPSSEKADDAGAEEGEGRDADAEAVPKDADIAQEDQQEGDEAEAAEAAAAASESAAEAAQAKDNDAIAQAEARVDAARAGANTTHEALVGVQLAIKEVLAVGTSNIDNAHEGGAEADDLLTNLQNANAAAQKAVSLREQLKVSKSRDEAAQAALDEAKKALVALRKQTGEAAAMKDEEAAKRAQHEQDKIDAASAAATTAKPDGITAIPAISSGSADAVVGMGAASGLGPDDELLSPRQRLFKELGERLLRLATPHKKRIDLVDNLDEKIETLKQKVNVTETERKILQDKLAELEAVNMAKNSVAGVEAQGKGSVLQYVSEQLAHVNKAVQRMAPLARRIAEEEAAKKGETAGAVGEKKEEAAEGAAGEDIVATATALLEKVGHARYGETPIIDGATVDSESGDDESSDDEGTRPRTVADLAKATADSSSGSGDGETFATVVADVPADGGDASRTAGAGGSGGASAAAAQPLQPVDPTAPGQRSVADQVFEALGGKETFSEAEKEDSPQADSPQAQESGSHLNSPTWKGNAEASDADTPASTEKDIGGGSEAAAVTSTRASTDAALSKAGNPASPEKEVPGIQLSTNTRETTFGPDEEMVARQEMVGAAVDAKVAKARLEYAQQRQVSSEQQEQLESAQNMVSMQERAVDGKRATLKKAEDEALVSKTRLESAQKAQKASSGVEAGVKGAVVERLQSATAARNEVVKGHTEALVAEEARLKEHEALVVHLRNSIKQTQEKLAALAKARNVAVKSQQVVAEKTAETQARYGLRHEVQKLIEKNDPTTAAAALAGMAARSRVHGATERGSDKEDGEVAQTLAKEGKTFTDAAQWRLDQVRTGEAGPIRVPSQPTEHELASAVGAVVGAERGSQLAATHGVGAAAVAMSTAGGERHPPTAAAAASFLEERASAMTKERLPPEQIREKAERILQDSKESLKASETSAMNAGGDRSVRVPRAAAAAAAAASEKRITTADRLMQAAQDEESTEDSGAIRSPGMMRFSEAQSKVESTASALLASASLHSRKSSSALALAQKLRQHALDVAQRGKLAVDTGLTGLAEVAEQRVQANRLAEASPTLDSAAQPVGTQKTFFENLPRIHGDALFESTRKWLQSHDGERRSTLPSAYGEQREAKKPYSFEPPRFEAIRSSLVPAHEDLAPVGQPVAMRAYGSSFVAPTQHQLLPSQLQQPMLPMMDAMMKSPLPDLMG